MASPCFITSSPIPYCILCYLPSNIVKNLKSGVNFINAPSTNQSEEPLATIRLIIYRDTDGNLVVCRNRCRHLGGNFVQDIESTDIVRCAFHGWKLNAKTLRYVHPPDCLKQKPLRIETQEDGTLAVMEPSQYEPWTVDAQEKQNLDTDELVVSYISHACVGIQAGNTILITDPWLTGPAFGRGWWLLHEPPSDAFDRVARADAICITSARSDQLNLPTLRKLAIINPAVAIYVPQFITNRFQTTFQQLGLHNVKTIPFGVWQKLQTNDETFAQFMILPDHRSPDRDTALLFEYKGHRVLNVANCASPNGDFLPYGVDILLSGFTPTETGYPCCFVEQYGEDKVVEIAKKKASAFLKKTIKQIQLCYPSVWVPFAGYFIEVGPHDEKIRGVNWKNSPDVAVKRMESRFPRLQTWHPFPGGKFDLALKKDNESSRRTTDCLKKAWNFQPYIDQLNQSMEFEPLKTMEGVNEYFQWAAFKDYDLILHVTETSNDYLTTIREYYIDFMGPRPILLDFPPGNRPLLRIRGRASVFRDTFIQGCSWEGLYTGFSIRLSLDPDIYHSKFWDHFLTKLPHDPPAWHTFHQPLPPT